MILENPLIWNAATMGSTTIYSTAINVSKCQGCSLQAVWTGSSASGVLKVQFSLDLVPNAMNSGQVIPYNWNDYTGSPLTLSSSSGGSNGWLINPSGLAWVRLAYVGSSGSGTISAQALKQSFINY